jgi:outer membrane protein OmpA-like peptidoglycan-associated protein
MGYSRAGGGVPWTCQACEAEVDEDGLTCPVCSTAKSSWSLVAGETRMFSVPGRRVAYLRGEGEARLPKDGDCSELVLVETERAFVMPKRDARELAKRGELPLARQVLIVQLLASGERDLTLELELEFETLEVSTVELPVESVGEEHVLVPLLFVHGEGEPPTITGMHVVDVTEETELKHAPSVQASALSKRQQRIALTSRDKELKLASVLEIEDAQFSHDSAVLLPEFGGHLDGGDDAERLTGLSVLRACLLHAEENPDQKLLVAGHTDTSGGKAYNLGLSRQRATNVLHALKGDRQAWAQSCEDKHKVCDVQEILTWAFRVFDWETAPGAVDDDMGKKTRAALKAFQKRHNREFEGSLPETGELGVETWAAFFDLYMKVLAKVLLETDAVGLKAKQDRLVFLDPATVGCGESHPVESKGKDGLKSAANRRVELLFFDPGEEPDLLGTCHPGEACKPDACLLYNDEVFERRHLPIAPVPGVMLEVTLSLVDELGQPLEKTAVVLEFDNGARSEVETDPSGRVQVELVQGVDFKVVLADFQEIAAGHGVETPSGVHFAPADQVPAGQVSP